MVSLNEWEAFIMGGYTNGHGNSKRNWFVYNPENKRFEDLSGSMMYEHAGQSDFTRIPQDALALKDCKQL